MGTGITIVAVPQLQWPGLGWFLRFFKCLFSSGDLQSAKAKHAGAEVVGLDAYPASLERSKAFAAEWAGKEAMGLDVPARPPLTCRFSATIPTLNHWGPTFFCHPGTVCVQMFSPVFTSKEMIWIIFQAKKGRMTEAEARRWDPFGWCWELSHSIGTVCMFAHV